MILIPLIFQLSPQFLLMEPIENVFGKREFQTLYHICQKRISVNLEKPFDLVGYFQVGDFIAQLSASHQHIKINTKEWISQQIRDNFAIHSINLELVDERINELFYYKYIFFMVKQEADIRSMNFKTMEIEFHQDPLWTKEMMFEVYGSANEIHDGWYVIRKKKGSKYLFFKKNNLKTSSTDIMITGRAKIWQLYYIRGINL